MGWSLGLEVPDSSPLSDATFAAFGKALYLANEYERKCRFLLRVARLGRYVSDHPEASFADALTSAAKDKLLAPTIAELGALSSVTASNLESLNAARVARNYVAHEGAAFGPMCHVAEKNFLRQVTRLRREVRELARGDSIVSGWVYAVEERTTPPRSMVERYPEMIDRWVFGPIIALVGERNMSGSDIT